MLTLTTKDTLAIDDMTDHLAQGNGRIYPSLVPEQGGPGAGDIEAGKGMTGENQSQSTTQADMALGTRTNRHILPNIQTR